MGKLQLEEEVSEKDTTTINALKDLENVTVHVIFPIEHDGKRYERGSKVTLPRIHANFHIQNGNCEIAK